MLCLDQRDTSKHHILHLVQIRNHKGPTFMYPLQTLDEPINPKADYIGRSPLKIEF